MSQGIEIDSIGQIAIAVGDLERAIDFYQRILGLPLLFQAPPELAFFSCNGVRLMLTTLQGSADDHHTSVIYYKVDDINRVFEQLSGLGVDAERAPQMVAEMPDHELWMGFIRDPDGNLIGIMEEVSL